MMKAKEKNQKIGIRLKRPREKVILLAILISFIITIIIGLMEVEFNQITKKNLKSSNNYLVQTLLTTK